MRCRIMTDLLSRRRTNSRQMPVDKMNFDQVDDLMRNLGLLTRNERIVGFKGLPAALEDKRHMSSEVLRRGLEM